MGRGVTTIKVSEQAWAYIMKLRTELSMRKGRSVSVPEVIDHILQCYAIKCEEESYG